LERLNPEKYHKHANASRDSEKGYSLRQASCNAE